jgi:type I restriction enzyme S subunit
MVNYSPIQIGESKEKFWRKLTDLADLETGHTPSRYHPEYWGGDIDWISISDITLETIYVEKTKEKITQLGVDNSSARFLPKGTVLLSRGPTIGKLCILPRPMTTNQSFVGWVPKSNLDTKYLYYLLLCSRSYFDSIGVGATMKTIYMKDAKNFYIYSPPLEEQKRIVAKIDTLFSKIDKAISLTENSLKQAKNLLPSVLNEVFEKGKADGWEEKRLEEVASYDKSKYKEHNRPYVGLEDIERNTSKFLGSKEPLNVKSSTFMFDERHVLYGRLRPYLNKVLVPDFSGHCSTEIFPILTNGKLIRRYLAYWLMSPVTNAKIDATWTGARMPRANMNEVIKFKLPLPTKETQKSIVNLFDDVSNQSKQTQSKLEEQLAYLKQLKSSILSKAFKGEM